MIEISLGGNTMRLLLLLITMAVCLQQGFAITCYYCDHHEPGCLHPDSLRDSQVKHCPNINFCQKSVSNEGSHMHRGCQDHKAHNGCDEQQGEYVCNSFCDTDLCNAQGMTRPLIWLAALSAVVLYIAS